MKKPFITILLIIITYFSYATTYYVSSSTGNDGNNGTSISSPWQTLEKVKLFNFSPGDQILLKKGDVWYEPLKVYSSGSDFQRITFSSYGSGNMPIVSVIVSHNSLNWTSLGNHIWSTSDVPYDPKRLLKDGVELLDAAQDRVQELGTNIPDLVEWYYDDDTHILKMYSIDSPENHDIKFSSELSALSIADEHNLNIQNIEFKGGYSTCAALTSCTNTDVTDCIFGENANFGVRMGVYIENGVSFGLSDNIVINNCLIDSKYTFNYSQAGTDYGTSDRGPREGVLFWGTINCELKNSTVKNYCHANINIFAPATEPGGTQLDERVVQNCKIYNNTITSPDIAYGGRMAIDGFCYDNEIYNNLFIDISVQNQFNGFNNHIHHNIFERVRNTPLKYYPTGNAIAIQGYYLEVYGNIFENNVMIDCESNGIFISGNNSNGNITNNIFRNNIIYNCGTDDNNIGLRVATDFNNYSNNGNIIDNNLIYCDITNQTIDFYDSVMDVATFNNDTTNNYSISNNIGFDPLFIDSPNDDFHLQENSPCIDVAIEPLATFDRDGNVIPYPGTLPDIGAYEFQNSLSISDYSNEIKILVYPNPTKSIIYIKNNSNSLIENVSIFDINGKLFKNYAIDGIKNNIIPISIANLHKGLFFLKLRIGYHNIIKKIIKE